MQPDVALAFAVLGLGLVSVLIAAWFLRRRGASFYLAYIALVMAAAVIALDGAVIVHAA
jgi:hypothetical protein